MQIGGDTGIQTQPGGSLAPNPARGKSNNSPLRRRHAPVTYRIQRVWSSNKKRTSHRMPRTHARYVGGEATGIPARRRPCWSAMRYSWMPMVTPAKRRQWGAVQVGGRGGKAPPLGSRGSARMAFKRERHQSTFCWTHLRRWRRVGEWKDEWLVVELPRPELPRIGPFCTSRWDDVTRWGCGRAILVGISV